MYQNYDVVVVGAGPAGSTAAYYLAKKNVKVLLVDRQDFPRHKACGGALINCRKWPFENYIAIKEELRSCEVQKALFYWHKKYVCEKTVDHLFDQVKRHEFDNLLLEEAIKRGASFRRFHVKSITPESRGNNLRYALADDKEHIIAKQIIGADGFNGVTAKFLGNPRTAYGLCQEYDIVCDKIDRKSRFFFLWGRELGYAWIFPTFEGYYAGLGFIGKTRKRLRFYLDDFMEYIIQQGLIPKHHTVRKMFGGPDPVAVVPNYCDKHIVLCGDSMGLVSQLAGDGIYYAMKSGKIAAEAYKEETMEDYGKLIKPVIDEVSLFRKIPPKSLGMFLARLILLAMTRSHTAQDLVFKKFFMRQ